MKNAWETYGVARVADRLMAARVENDGARLSVASLVTSDDGFSRDSLESGRLFFNVDARITVVKQIRIKRSGLLGAAELVQFEMSQALLDPPESFYFDNLPVDERNGYRTFLGIAYHRQEIDRQMAAYAELLRKPSGFKLDAVALAVGYLTFCRVEAGDLQLLIDLSPHRVTLAILFRRQLRQVGHLDLAPGEKPSLGAASQLAKEVKMTASYHLGQLFHDGITVPLSRIVLCGPLAADPLISAGLAEHFTTEITRPQFHEGYFQSSPAPLNHHLPEQFLIPLGLAVP